MFNVLPDDLRDPAVSITTFGRSMKTHLFSAYQHFQHIRGVLRNALYKCTILNYLLNKSKPIDARVIKSGRRYNPGPRYGYDFGFKSHSRVNVNVESLLLHSRMWDGHEFQNFKEICI